MVFQHWVTKSREARTNLKNTQSLSQRFNGLYFFFVTLVIEKSQRCLWKASLEDDFMSVGKFGRNQSATTNRCPSKHKLDYERSETTQIYQRSSSSLISGFRGGAYDNRRNSRNCYVCVNPMIDGGNLSHLSRIDQKPNQEAVSLSKMNRSQHIHQLHIEVLRFPPTGRSPNTRKGDAHGATLPDV